MEIDCKKGEGEEEITSKLGLSLELSGFRRIEKIYIFLQVWYFSTWYFVMHSLLSKSRLPAWLTDWLSAYTFCDLSVPLTIRPLISLRRCRRSRRMSNIFFFFKTPKPKHKTQAPRSNAKLSTNHDQTSEGKHEKPWGIGLENTRDAERIGTTGVLALQSCAEIGEAHCTVVC